MIIKTEFSGNLVHPPPVINERALRFLLRTSCRCPKIPMIWPGLILALLYTVYDVSVPDSWSSVPYTIGLWRKLLCDVIKMAAWCIIYSLLANNCTVPSSTVPYSLIMWLLFPSISYCVRDRDIVDGVIVIFSGWKHLSTDAPSHVKAFSRLVWHSKFQL